MTRLDTALTERGLARSRNRAARLIAAGAVTVNGLAASKASQRVAETDEVRVAVADPYVSRAAHKLIGALDDLRVDPAGLRCLDAGASTGGFTQVLLERGAAHVDAVDVGHDQLATEIREDPRVTNREGRNLRDMRPGELGPPVDLVVADVSFISLTVLLPMLRDLSRPGARIVAMIKPQFELARADLDSRGVVADARRRADAVRRVLDSATGLGLVLEGLAVSCLPGPSGNLECFARFSTGSRLSPPTSPMLGRDVDAFLAELATGGTPVPLRKEGLG